MSLESPGIVLMHISCWLTDEPSWTSYLCQWNLAGVGSPLKYLGIYLVLYLVPVYEYWFWYIRLIEAVQGPIRRFSVCKIWSSLGILCTRSARNFYIVPVILWYISSMLSSPCTINLAILLYYCYLSLLSVKFLNLSEYPFFSIIHHACRDEEITTAKQSMKQ